MKIAQLPKKGSIWNQMDPFLIWKASDAGIYITLRVPPERQEEKKTVNDY